MAEDLTLTYVLDACSMIAYLGGESGDDVVECLLLASRAKCITHAVNMVEVYNISLGSVESVQQILQGMTSFKTASFSRALSASLFAKTLQV